VGAKPLRDPLLVRSPPYLPHMQSCYFPRGA
jgi:hypothetical protein